jgi:hypothetical protein
MLVSGAPRPYSTSMHTDTSPEAEHQVSNRPADVTPNPDKRSDSKPTFSPPVPASSAVQIVWQWVCYGLWEWALFTLSLLLTAALSYFILDDNDTSTFVIYATAAAFCLVPLAFFVDRTYAKREPLQKHGFASVVMVLNAVVVFLVAVGAAIAIVVSTLAMFINGSSETLTITALSSSIVAALGAMLFIRIINPERLRKFSRLFPWIVMGVTGLAIILTVAGPIYTLRETRNDRLIEDNISTVNYAIENYISDNQKLPASLDVIDLDDTYQQDAVKLVKDKIVSYDPQTSLNTVNLEDIPKAYRGLSPATNQTMRYKLCVTFKREKGTPPVSNDNNALNGVSLDHPAGNVCYNLEY